MVRYLLLFFLWVSLYHVAWGQSLQPDTIRPSNTPLLRQTDAVWSRRIWQVIDLRQSMNTFLYQPTQSQGAHKSFITILMDAIMQGNVTVYDPLYDDFRIKMGLNEVKTSWSETYKRTYERPHPPYQQFDSVTTKTFDPKTVKKIKIKEEWFYNKQKGFMEVKIIGMCLVKENIDTTGEFKGYSDMFWIYFPELEPMLATEALAKPFSINKTQFNNYQDIFSYRFFLSYIYKEDNAYNRQIYEYTKQSLDALIEAEKSKEMIRISESDFWEE